MGASACSVSTAAACHSLKLAAFTAIMAEYMSWSLNPGLGISRYLHLMKSLLWSEKKRSGPISLASLLRNICCPHCSLILSWSPEGKLS